MHSPYLGRVIACATEIREKLGELARAYYAEWQRLWATVPLERVCKVVKVRLPMMVRD